MFDRKGQIIVDKEEYDGDADDLMMQALDAGAEDFAEDDGFEILTDQMISVRCVKHLKKQEFMASAEVTMIPPDLCRT